MKTREWARLAKMNIQRATDIEALFATAAQPQLVVFRADVGDDGPGLQPEEAALATTMSAHRRAVFAAGRAAAHAGLTHLGIPRQALLIGPGGAPLWPMGVVGSITHTDRVAYAAVAISTVALGIDAEERRRIDRSIIPTIMTDAEQAIWIGLEPDEADVFATITFSAKEALYKAQFVVTGAWLGFEHVETVRRKPAPLQRQSTPFEVAINIDESEQSPSLPGIERPMRAQSLVLADQVISAVVLSRPTSPTRSS